MPNFVRYEQNGGAVKPAFVRNRVSELRNYRGWTQADLGEKIGVHWQTISRIENSHTRLLPKREKAIAKTFDVDVDELYLQEPPKGMRRVQVAQHVQAGVFSESNFWEEEARYDVVVPDNPTFANFKLYGAETRGPSMNLRYPERTVLIFTDIIETDEQPEPGKRYIVECERADGLREATVKTLTKDSKGQLWLVPESDDPAFAPIPLKDADNQTIRIIGRVHYSVRRE